MQRAWMLAVAVMAMSSVAAAQQVPKPVTIAGVVRDTAGNPLLGAEVRVDDRYTLSNRDGKFVLDSVAPDTIPLTIRRIGYGLEDVLLVAKPGDRVEVAVRLTPIEVTLGTIVVEGKRLDTFLMKTGWYDRERLGMGVHFGPEYLKHFGGTMTGLIYNVPGVQIVRDHLNRATALAKLDGMHSCVLNVFLDGFYVSWAEEIGLDAIVNQQDVLAVEVYHREAEMPSSFGRARMAPSGGLPTASGGPPSSQGQLGVTSCGALMIWTKPVGKIAAEKSGS